MNQTSRPAGAGVRILMALMACTSCGSLPQSHGIVDRGAGKDRWSDALPREAWSAYPLVAQSQPWFEVYRLDNEVFAIYEPGQFEEVISYLVLGSERALLFDSGLGIGDMHGLVTELTDRPIVVLNSHTHYDHVGGNHQFAAVLGLDHPYTREHAEGRSSGELAEFVSPAWIAGELPEDLDVQHYASEPFSISAWVSDGQSIDLGGRSLEVLLTPGHTPDSLCLLDRGNRLLLTGDTIYPATLYVHLGDADLASYQGSADRLAGLADQVDQVLPGHNEPFMHPSSLTQLSAAFAALGMPETPFVLTDGNREYDFGVFSLLVRE